MTNRPAPREVRASDLLPTAQAVALAKGLAARACASQAADDAWPHINAAVAWIELIPMVALAALAELCPDVAVERLALCLGLDSAAAERRLFACRRRDRWSEDLVAAVVQQVRG